MGLNGQITVFDRLTGVFTPQYWRLRLAEECSRSERYLHFFSTLTLDTLPFILDKGEEQRTEKLSEIALLLRTNVRKTDIIGLMEDGNFALILPETPSEGAEVVVRRLTELLTLMEGPGKPVRMKLALYPRDGSRDIDLIEKLGLPLTGG